MVHCCAAGCNEMGVHRFPKDKRLRRKWTNALKRDKFSPSNSSRLCSNHFKSDDFVVEGFYSGVPLERKILIKGAIPSIFSPKAVAPSNGKTLPSSTRVRKRPARFQEKNPSDIEPEAFGSECDSDIVSDNTLCPALFVTTDLGDEIMIDSDKMGSGENESCGGGGAGSSSLIPGLLTIDKIYHHCKAMSFYTGFESYKVFLSVFDSLCPRANNLQYDWDRDATYLSPQNALLLTLMKLKKNKTDFELSLFFGVPESYVPLVYITWLRLMEQVWSLFKEWPSQDIVNKYLLKEYKTTILSNIVDAIKQSPVLKSDGNQTSQQATSSAVKSPKKMKILVRYSPGDPLSVKASANGKSVTDCTSYKDCKSSKVMKDSNFSDLHLLTSNGVILNLSDSQEGATELLTTTEALPKNDHLEKVQIIVKTYRILSVSLGEELQPLTAVIFSVCYMLWNFRKGAIV